MYKRLSDMIFHSDPCQKKAVPELIEVAGRCFTVYSYYKVSAGFEMRATARKGIKSKAILFLTVALSLLLSSFQ